MKQFRIAGMLFVLVLSISAIVSATASAALPEFKGTLPTKLTGTSGEGKLKDTSTELTIKCTKDTVTGEITGAKTSTATVDFEKCTLVGLAAESLGDEKGNILVPVTGTLCYINKAKTEVGTLFVLPSGGIHIEAPSTGELVVVTGSVVGKTTPVNTSSTTGTVELPTTALKCEGAKAPEDELLIEKEHNGKTLPAIETTTESLTFANALTLSA